MVYEQFLQVITSTLQEQLGGSFSIVFKKIPKNNGVVMDGLCISRKSDSIAPAIYLNPYYEQFTEGMPLEDILTDIQQVYDDHRSCPAFSPDHFSIFSDVRGQIVFKLIHAESNQTLLEQLPHLIFLDLALVFYLHLEHNEHGQMSALIYNEHLSLWETDIEELIGLAKENTPRLFPPSLSRMRDVMKEIAKSNLKEDYNEELMDCLLEQNDQEELYLLTNTYGIYGSCCMIYEQVLQQFAESMGKDLIILPSSVHEVLLLPEADDISYDDLRGMVRHINLSDVPKEDFLSNQIYRYSREQDLIAIIHESVQNNQPPS